MQFPKFLLVASLLTTGCITDEAAKACRDVIAKEAPGIERRIWEQCSQYYEEVALPKLQEQLNEAAKKLVDEIEKRIGEKLSAYGCVAVTGDGGTTWDCRNTALCK